MVDGDDCELCGGCGEIDQPDVQRMGPVPCPECVSGELNARIAELEAALKPFADAVYNDNGDITLSHPDVGRYMAAKRVLKQKT
jgi:hypothetical protein